MSKTLQQRADEEVAYDERLPCPTCGHQPVLSYVVGEDAEVFCPIHDNVRGYGELPVEALIDWNGKAAIYGDEPPRKRKRAVRRPVWCVQHRDGWCATFGGRRPTEAQTTVETRCRHFVILPYGFERRQPDCDDCKRKAADRG